MLEGIIDSYNSTTLQLDPPIDTINSDTNICPDLKISSQPIIKIGLQLRLNSFTGLYSYLCATFISAIFSSFYDGTQFYYTRISLK